MALQELDSFIFKFKNLLTAGRSASLRMTSSAGKAEVHLSVELDDVPPVTLLPPQSSRNGPARQRRREKRAAARQAAEKELHDKGATVEVSADEPDMKVIAEQAIIEKSGSDATVDVAEGVRIDKECEELVDEFCPDEEFNFEASEHEFKIFEVFKISFSDKGWSNMNESQILNEMQLSLDYTFNLYKVKIEERTFTVVKSEKCAEAFKVLLKVKNLPDVLKAVRGLKTQITDVRKLAKRRLASSSLPPS